jgi:hypothetical protein
VYYSELWGLREEQKYPELRKNDITTTQWQLLSPKPEFYLFVPRDEKLLEKYGKYPRITEIFQLNSVSIVTARDKLTIQWTPEEMWTTILNFSKLDPELARSAYNLGRDVDDWKVTSAQQDLLDSGLDKRKIIPILYRPFDERYTYYTGKSQGFICRPREKIMNHMLAGPNICLIYTRSISANKPYEHIFCAQYGMIGRFYPDAGCVTYFSPLYLYSDVEERDLFNHTQKPGHKEPNLNPGLLATLSQTYHTTPTPEEIFAYIYAVLYSNTYRTKYAEFLKIDFPRIPFTTDYDLFRQLGAYGQRLVDLHLLNSPELDPPLAKFQGEGESNVEKLKYNQQTQQVFINPHQYFDGVPLDIWEYQIGGYQVCEKWLKDRKGRRLSLEDVKHYCKVVTTLQKTIKIQKEIDSIYSAIEKTQEKK